MTRALPTRTEQAAAPALVTNALGGVATARHALLPADAETG